MNVLVVGSWQVIRVVLRLSPNLGRHCSERHYIHRISGATKFYVPCDLILGSVAKEATGD